MDIHDDKFFGMVRSHERPDHYYEVAGSMENGRMTCECPDCRCRQKYGDLAAWWLGEPFGGCKHQAELLIEIAAIDALKAIYGPDAPKETYV